MKDHRIADKLIEQRFEEISKKTDALPKTQVNYIFVTDTHADEYLLKDENGKLTVFEPEDTVNDRINQIAKHLEIAVNIANKNDNIDFIAVGGDLMNAYCINCLLYTSLRNYYYISVRPAPGNGLVIYYGSRAAGITVTRIGRYGTVGMIPIIGIRACYVIRQIAAAVCAQGAVRRNIRALIGRIRRIRGNGVSARILRGTRFF